MRHRRQRVTLARAYRGMRHRAGGQARIRGAGLVDRVRHGAYTFPQTCRENTLATRDLIESVVDGVATLTLNRPDSLNALSRPMLDAMIAALNRWAADEDVGCVVVTGAGRGFCAGGDVKAMAAGRPADESLDDKRRSLRERMEVSRILHEMPQPTIAMVNGPAAGPGLSVALACDMRFMAAGAATGTGFPHVGPSGAFVAGGAP